MRPCGQGTKTCASKSQDHKEAAELLSKAILELALAIEATDAKVKKINKSS